MKKLKRRDFLKFSGGAILSSFVIPEELLADDGKSFNDFKVLVVVDMMGGNDAINTYIPANSQVGINTGYEAYSKARSGVVRIEDKDLMDELRGKIDSSGYLSFSNTSSNPYYTDGSTYKSYIKGFYLLDKNGFDKKVAINPMMPEVAYWLDRGKGAIIQNVGNISQPITKDGLRSGSDPRPPFLFAHNQQSILMRTGQASSITFPTGWLGRVADKWKGLNGNDVYKMNINLSSFGRYKMFFGNSTEPMAYNSNGPIDFAGLDTSLQNEMADVGINDMFHSLYSKINKEIITQTRETVADWNSVSGNNEILKGLKDSYGIEFYDNRGRIQLPSKTQYGLNEGGLNWRNIVPFMTAAKLIKIGKNKDFKRMVISIALGGYDQHSTQPLTHSQRLRNFSMGIDRFMRSIEHLNLTDNVTLFTVSEFARSTGSNRDGTDHAWGGAYMVLGGAVKPGNYGLFPDLTLGSDDDYTDKGRLIPSTSFTQYYTTLLKWFGVDDEIINYALPELKNFEKKDLGFLG